MKQFKNDDEIIQLISDCKVEQVSVLSQIVELSENKIKDIVEGNNWSQKYFLGSWVGITDEIADSLIAEDDWSLNKIIAYNPKASNNILYKLACLKDSRIDEALIKNVNLPNEALSILIKNRKFKYEAIRHPNFDPKKLARLASSSDKKTVEAVASNVNTPLSILEKLSKDNDKPIRVAVASNINASLNLLSSMLDDEYYYVKQAICNNQHSTSDMIKQLLNEAKGYSSGLIVIARNKNTPADILEELSQNSVFDVRKAARFNPNFAGKESTVLPEDVLEKLFAPDVTIVALQMPISDYYFDDEDAEYFSDEYTDSCNRIHPIMLERIIKSNDREEVISVLKALITTIGEIDFADTSPFEVTNLEYLEFNNNNPRFMLFSKSGERIFYTRETWKEYANAFTSKYGEPKQSYPIFELTLSDTDLFLTICPECGNNLKLGASWDNVFSEYDYTINCPCGKTSYSFSSYYN